MVKYVQTIQYPVGETNNLFCTTYIGYTAVIALQPAAVPCNNQTIVLIYIYTSKIQCCIVLFCRTFFKFCLMFREFGHFHFVLVLIM